MDTGRGREPWGDCILQDGKVNGSRNQLRARPTTQKVDDGQRYKGRVEFQGGLNMSVSVSGCWPDWDAHERVRAMIRKFRVPFKRNEKWLGGRERERIQAIRHHKDYFCGLSFGGSSSHGLIK